MQKSVKMFIFEINIEKKDPGSFKSNVTRIKYAS